MGHWDYFLNVRMQIVENSDEEKQLTSKMQTNMKHIANEKEEGASLELETNCHLHLG